MRNPFHFGTPLCLGIAPGGLALVRAGGWRRGHPRLLGEVPGGADAGALDALLDGHDIAGKALTVVLSDDLVRLWQVAPPAGATRMADLEGAAALRFQALFGAGGDWRIDADWQARRPFLAAALPQALRDMLVSAAQARRCTLVGIVPHFVAALNRFRRQRRAGAWFGVVHGGVLGLAAFDGAAFAALRTAPVPAGAGRAWLDAHVAREALRIGLDVPARLQLCGTAPSSWAGTGAGAGAAIVCTLLGDPADPQWSDSARLAAMGQGR